MSRTTLFALLVALALPVAVHAQEPTIESVQGSLTHIEAIAAEHDVALLPGLMGMERVHQQLLDLTVQAALSMDLPVIAATLSLHRRYQSLLEVGLQRMIDSCWTCKVPLPAERAASADSVSYDYVTAMSTVLRVAFTGEGNPTAKGLVAYRLWRNDMRQLHALVPDLAYAIELLAADVAYEGLLQMPFEDTFKIGGGNID